MQVRLSPGSWGRASFFHSNSPPGAVFTIADTLALGVLKVFKNTGMQVPEQVALASLDDISIAGLVDPGLTTVALPARKLGLEAIKMLQHLVDGREPAEKQIVLPTALVVRQSCGCP